MKELAHRNVGFSFFIFFERGFIMEMKIKSTFMKTMISKIVSKQLKKTFGENSGFTLIYCDIVPMQDGTLEAETSFRIRIRPEDLKKFLEEKEII